MKPVDSYVQYLSARSLAGLLLRDELETLLSLMDDGRAKQELARALAEHNARVNEARAKRAEQEKAQG